MKRSTFLLAGLLVIATTAPAFGKGKGLRKKLFDLLHGKKRGFSTRYKRFWKANEKGYTVIPCRYCGGNGCYAYEPCPICKGLAKILVPLEGVKTCRYCGGRGQYGVFICEICKGSTVAPEGNLRGFGPGPRQTIPCKYCDGDGSYAYSVCEICDGFGEIEVPKQGVRQCHYCRGCGQYGCAPCPICSGVGKLW